MNPSPHKPRLLVVEDEAIVCADIQDRLGALGYDVVGSADTGAGAIHAAATLKPELVLMDIILKGEMTGIEAAAHIRSQLHLPVIYLTANSNEAMFCSAQATDPFGFIFKPFDELALRANIEIALYKHRMEREREILITQLQEALAKVRTLSGMIPICAWCKKLRNDEGYWKSVEQYLADHSQAEFTHGICPGCSSGFLKKAILSNSAPAH